MLQPTASAGMAAKPAATHHATAVRLQPSRYSTPTKRPLERLSRYMGTVFSQPCRGFLHAPGRPLLRSLHSSGTRSAKGHHQQGWTSDLISSDAREQGGPLRMLQYSSLLLLSRLHQAYSTPPGVLCTVCSLTFLYSVMYVFSNKLVLS
jgi:hypothetical protein